jgi:hypothetical protein
VEFYIKVGKPFASSYPNHCFAWLFNYLSLSRISSFAWCLILILFICFFVVKMISDLCVKYHRETNNSKYLLSMDKWYFIMWYIFWLSLHWLLLLITLPLTKKCICFNSHCLPWLLWFHLILLNLFCVILNVGWDDDPICVHFVFKYKIINNALILGELSYICYNILLWLISIGIGYCWKTNLFFWVLSVPS